MIVKVYWNLNKNCWSIQKNGLVIDRVNTVLLKNVVFQVSEAGRQRVIQEKRKNVHAFAKGELVLINQEKPSSLNLQITYNPYKFGYFYEKLSENKVETNPLVFCGNKVLFGLRENSIDSLF